MDRQPKDIYAYLAVKCVTMDARLDTSQVPNG